jgi:hypothetical protein
LPRWERRIDSMSKEVTEIINTLCEKLGVAASVLVPELAKYNIARLTFLTVVQTILAVVMAVIVVKLVKWCLSDEDADWEDKALGIFMTNIIPGIALLVLIYFAIGSATDLIGWIASPTASAVKEITSMIK